MVHASAGWIWHRGFCGQLPTWLARGGALRRFGGGTRGSDWPLPNLDLSSTRALRDQRHRPQERNRLHVVWRFRFRIAPVDSGAFTATPVVAAGVVYLQDMKSNVFALDLATGALRWQHIFAATNPGPDGVAVAGNRIYGATDSVAFALSRATGRLVWQHRLVSASERFVDLAPQVANGLVYLSTIGEPPNGRGALYALDADTGERGWKFNTIKGPWRIPAEASGGGLGHTHRSRSRRLLGNGESLAVGWHAAAPERRRLRRARPLHRLAARARRRYRNAALVRPGDSHDVRDHDFQLPPILGSIGKAPVVFGAGKRGLVIAWNRDTHRRIWQAEVGLHRNDKGPLPTHPVVVCPGLFGGVLTPMAYAEGTLFVPVVDLCMRGSAYGYEPLEKVDSQRPGEERARLVALWTRRPEKKHIWTQRLPQPSFSCATVADGVVFTATFDGTIYAFDTRNGKTLWTTNRSRAELNACPKLSGRTADPRSQRAGKRRRRRAGDRHIYGPEGIDFYHAHQVRHLTLAGPSHVEGRPRLPSDSVSAGKRTSHAICVARHSLRCRLRACPSTEARCSRRPSVPPACRRRPGRQCR